MIEGDPKTPEVKPQQTPAEMPLRRYPIPDVDEIIDRRAADEVLGNDYNPWEDPEDLTTYLEPYQNDY